ncbi:2485_t:CDS:2 [Entrophospora sp. SA101]|nr:2485_t:CDS:2 [Entrophospora sp. SA101]
MYFIPRENLNKRQVARDEYIDAEENEEDGNDDNDLTLKKRSIVEPSKRKPKEQLNNSTPSETSSPSPLPIKPSDVLTNALASLPSSSITTTNTEKEDLPYLNDDLEGQNHGEDDEKNHGSCLSDTFGSCIAQNAENESIDSLPSSDEPSSSDHDDENVKDQQGGRGGECRNRGDEDDD